MLKIFDIINQYQLPSSVLLLYYTQPIALTALWKYTIEISSQTEAVSSLSDAPVWESGLLLKTAALTNPGSWCDVDRFGVKTRGFWRYNLPIKFDLINLM